MNCKDWEERLALYVGGDLSAAEATQVERHLGECAGCQLFSSGLKEGLELLQESHREPLPPAHFAAVRARVLAELERQRRPFWRRGWVFGLAAVAVALLVMMLAIRPGPAPTARPPMVATEHPPVPPEPLATGTQPDEGVSPIQSVLPASPPHKRRARPKMETGEPVLIRVVQDNPDVVIYWIADTTGE